MSESKSELKRMCVMEPIKAAKRLYELEQQLSEAQALIAMQEAYERKVKAKTLEECATKWLPNMRRNEFESSVDKASHNMAVDACVKHVLYMAAELTADTQK